MRILPPTDFNMEEAAKVLRLDGLVVMPTETVYGLAGSAMSALAVQRIFAAKGRPASNPLIVHVASRDQLDLLALEVTPLAERLIAAFWPGPITVVLNKSTAVLDSVTAGGPTVAVRMPDHPVAQELISRLGQPLAAPSANRFMGLSPTRAEDVSPELGIDIVLDGGRCDIGLESTVVDCTGPRPIILRLGHISAALIAEVSGPLDLSPGESSRSPGQHSRHYAPHTPLSIVKILGANDGGLTFAPISNPSQIQMPSEPRTYGAALFAALHELDSFGLTQIFVEAPPDDPEWQAIWDRLSRAQNANTLAT